MRKTVWFLMGAAALLSACGEKKASEPQTREEVRQEVQKVQLKPGQWEGSYELEDIDMPNMPGGADR